MWSATTGVIGQSTRVANTWLAGSAAAAVPARRNTIAAIPLSTAASARHVTARQETIAVTGLEDAARANPSVLRQWGQKYTSVRP